MMTWVLDHKQLVLLCFQIFLTIVYILIMLFKKDKVVKDDKLSWLLSYIPKLIQLAESSYPIGNGEKKLNLVLEMLKALAVKIHYSGDFDFSSYVENILSCPEKKGGP